MALLKRLFALFPFDLRGDGRVSPAKEGIKISCIINFYGRLDLLSRILFSLSEQDIERDLFEVILVEDRGGSEGGEQIAEQFSALLPIVYAPLDKNYGYIGYAVNRGLSSSRGEYVLFLDDDTMILQKDFLKTVCEYFESHGDVDAIFPKGNASYVLLNGKYDYHDPYFMTNRCTAYRRTALAELEGFVSDIIGQEDVEFFMRFIMAGKKSENVASLNYYHPPLILHNLRKPVAVGYSFYSLKRRYPFFIWLMVLLNCSRHAPLFLVPVRKYREMGRFGIGVFLGILAGLTGRKGLVYH